MEISEGTVLAHANGYGWTKAIQIATRGVMVMQSDSMTAPQSLVAMLAERRDRTKLALNGDTVEAAEQVALHPDKLEIAHKVKNVAGVHKKVWLTETEASPF
jgi:hypothetical protein